MASTHDLLGTYLRPFPTPRVLSGVTWEGSTEVDRLVSCPRNLALTMQSPEVRPSLSAHKV